MSDQYNLGVNQQIFIGVAGEVFSASFLQYFTDFTHKIYSDTMSPTGISFLGAGLYPSNVSSFIKDCLRANSMANIMLIHHMLPRSFDFMMQNAVFFKDESDGKYRGFYLSNSTVTKIKIEEMFPAIQNPQWLFENLKNKLVLDYNIQFSDEFADVIL